MSNRVAVDVHLCRGLPVISWDVFDGVVTTGCIFCVFVVVFHPSRGKLQHCCIAAEDTGKPVSVPLPAAAISDNRSYALATTKAVLPNEYDLIFF